MHSLPFVKLTLFYHIRVDLSSCFSVQVLARTPLVVDRLCFYCTLDGPGPHLTIHEVHPYLMVPHVQLLHYRYLDALPMDQ